MRVRSNVNCVSFVWSQTHTLTAGTFSKQQTMMTVAAMMNLIVTSAREAGGRETGLAMGKKGVGSRARAKETHK